MFIFPGTMKHRMAPWLMATYSQRKDDSRTVNRHRGLRQELLYNSLGVRSMIDYICWIFLVLALFLLNYFRRLLSFFGRQIFENKCMPTRSHPADTRPLLHKRPQTLHVHSVYYLSPHCSPGRPETRVLKIHEVPFCFLQSMIWFPENRLTIFN